MKSILRPGGHQHHHQEALIVIRVFLKGKIRQIALEEKTYKNIGFLTNLTFNQT